MPFVDFFRSCFLLATLLVANTAFASDTMVLLIDMQNSCLEQADSKKKDKLIEKQLELIREGKKRGFFFAVVKIGVAIERSELALDSRIQSALVDYEHQYNIYKNKASLFDDSEARYRFLTFVELLKTKKIIVAGVHGSACVYHSVRDLLAMELGIQVLTSPDLVGDFILDNQLYPDNLWFKKLLANQNFTSSADLDTLLASLLCESSL